MARFGLCEMQATSILDIQLRLVAAVERQKIEDEHRDVSDKIA